MASVQKYKIELSFACRDLVDLDTITLTDPFIRVYEQVGANWTRIGDTEVIYNNLNPQFAKSFPIDFYFENKQPFKVEVYHHDSADKSVLIGTVEFLLSSLMGLKDDILEKEIIDTVGRKPKRGFMMVRFDRIDKLTSVRLGVQGHRLAKKRFCGDNNNMLEIYKPKGVQTIGQYIGEQTSNFDFLNSKIPESEWILVHRSEVINSNTIASWSPIVIQKSKLCSDNDHLPLLFKVMDYATNSGDHKLVGGTILTFAEIKGINLAKNAKEILKKGRSNRGTLSFPLLQEDKTYDFVDFLRGGLNIALFIGIDFTSSNGTPTQPTSLHYIDPTRTKLNPYQSAILSVGEILLDYDDDKMVPVYGFGADLKYPDLKSQGVSHSFPCTGLVGNEEVNGLQGIFEVYEYAHKYITLNGPTHFAPLFRDIVKKAKQRFNENPDNYSFFMIITDGDIHDMVETVGVLVQAAEEPLSLVIVGVGNDSFEKMRRLDEGNCTDLSGRKPSRDICRFVRFMDFQNNKELLRKEVLAEIPTQIVEYYKKIGRPPNPPRGIARSFDVGRRTPQGTGNIGFQQPIPQHHNSIGTSLGPSPTSYMPPVKNMSTLKNEIPELQNIQLSYPAPPGFVEMMENEKQNAK